MQHRHRTSLAPSRREASPANSILFSLLSLSLSHLNMRHSQLVYVYVHSSPPRYSQACLQNQFIGAFEACRAAVYYSISTSANNPFVMSRLLSACLALTISCALGFVPPAPRASFPRTRARGEACTTSCFLPRTDMIASPSVCPSGRRHAATPLVDREVRHGAAVASIRTQLTPSEVGDQNLEFGRLALLIDRR